jgi:hypothetical protein
VTTTKKRNGFKITGDLTRNPNETTVMAMMMATPCSVTAASGWKKSSSAQKQQKNL